MALFSVSRSRGKSRARSRLGARLFPSCATLFLLALLALPIATVLAEGDHDEEDPLEHIMETYDEDEGHTLDSEELHEMFEAIHNRLSGKEAAADAHAGHAHHDDHGGDDDDDHGDEEEEILTIEHILEDYGTSNVLTEDQFKEACPAMLRCVLDDACEFEHEEEHEDDHDSKDHLGLKMGLLAGIFFEALIGGVLPFFIVKSVESADPVVSVLNAFSGGVFLTAGLTHILPHVIESSAEVDHGDYPLPYALVIIGYLLVFLVEKVLFHTHAHDTHDHDHDAHEHEHHGHGHGHEKKDVELAPVEHAGDHGPNLTSSLVLLLAISLHAILAGVTLGMQTESDNVTTIAVAIISHKAPAAFSIGTKFMRNGLDFKTSAALIALFACVTPVGIGIGIAAGSSDATARLVLEGLAAGTFIYIGATEIATDEFETSSKDCAYDADGKGAHSHRVHAAPDRAKRITHFAAYVFGVFVILMSNLAPHADH